MTDSLVKCSSHVKEQYENFRIPKSFFLRQQNSCFKDQWAPKHVVQEMVVKPFAAFYALVFKSNNPPLFSSQTQLGSEWSIEVYKCCSPWAIPSNHKSRALLTVLWTNGQTNWQYKERCTRGPGARQLLNRVKGAALLPQTPRAGARAT